MTIDEIISAECEAEDKIRRILLDLENATGLRVGWVKVDTRNFAGCTTEVSLNARAKAEGEK